jgi:putative endonuclease
LYTGITNDVERRLEEHLSGKGGHYTSHNKPLKIIYQEPFIKVSSAEKREQQIKRWSKVKKLALIDGDLNRLREYSISRD